MSHALSRLLCIRSLVAASPRRALSRLRPVASVVGALLLLAVSKPVIAFERVGAITLESGENRLWSAVIDPAGEFAYFGTATEPSRVVKVDLGTFERISVIPLENGENNPRSAVIDPAGEFVYFGAVNIPGRVVKIDLETFARVGAIPLGSGENSPSSAVIDPAGEFAYFGTNSSPGLVVKIDLETFERVGAIPLDNGENFLLSAVIDPAGEFAYFGTVSSPGLVVKIDLETFERVDAIELEDGENDLLSAVIDPAGEFAYFGTDTTPGRVVKVDLGTFERIGVIPLENGENSLRSAVIDPAGEFAYFGTLADPGRVVKIDLETFERVDAIELDDGEDDLLSAVIDPAGAFAYFGTDTSPGRVVKIGLQATEVFTPVALAADPEPLMALSDGNAVFEPGERVLVAPAWRNDGMSSQPLIGTAAGFSGPTGPTYTLVDGDADYGTVEPQAISSCLDIEDCYAMEITPAGTPRPAPHWDAAFDETLSDESVKTWTLHVGDSFEDVPRSNPFYGAIETLLHRGVSSEPALARRDLLVVGCGEGQFCPAEPHTRAQSAVFLLKAASPDLTPPPCVEGDQRFADVPFDSPFCPWIEELARREITAGCGNGNYCPDAPVSRGQMAVLLLRASQGADYTPPECTGAFIDVPCSSPFADWSEDLLTRDITAGCATSPLRYCPAEPVARQQMAVFVTRAFELVLYGP